MPNEQEQKFCHHFLQTFNAKGAINYAGYECENPLIVAHELLSQSHIKKYIKRLQKEKQQSDFLSKQDIVQKYAQLAFADLNDYILQNCEEVASQGAVSQSDMQAQSSEKDSAASKSVNFDGTLLNEIKKTSGGLSVKLPDRMKALAWLSDYFELNPKDVHRREIEKRKLQLEAIKISAGVHEEHKGGEEPSEQNDEEQNAYEQEQIDENSESYEFDSASSSDFLNSANAKTDDIWQED